MRDLLLSLLIGGTVVVGATETIGVTHILQGQNPTAAVRQALPEFPTSFIPDAARALPGMGGSAPEVATATAVLPPASRSMYIAHTGGSGVRARAVCADEAPGPAGVAEGTAIQVQRIGGSECPGWALVSTSTLEFWVRMAFLDASAPKALPETRADPNADKRRDDGRTGDGTAKRADEGHRDDEAGKRNQKGDLVDLTPTPTAFAAPPNLTPTATATASASAVTTATTTATATATPRGAREEPRDDD